MKPSNKLPSHKEPTCSFLDSAYSEIEGLVAENLKKKKKENSLVTHRGSNIHNEPITANENSYIIDVEDIAPQKRRQNFFLKNAVTLFKLLQKNCYR